jgi:hypothetical protein
MISVLETLLVDQRLADKAEEWYEFLADWRHPKFIPIGNKPNGVNASVAATLQDAPVPAEDTPVLPDERQSRGLSSGELDREPGEEDESTQIEVPESLDGLSPAELLLELRVRHGTLSVDGLLPPEPES